MAGVPDRIGESFRIATGMRGWDRGVEIDKNFPFARIQCAAMEILLPAMGSLIVDKKAVVPETRKVRREEVSGLAIKCMLADISVLAGATYLVVSGEPYFGLGMKFLYNLAVPFFWSGDINKNENFIRK